MAIMPLKQDKCLSQVELLGMIYEPYTMQNVLQYQGKYYVCGTGRQTLVKNKTSNDNIIC